MSDTPKLPTCSCGHDRNHPLVVRKNKYTRWGFIGMCVGISVKPIFARYLCTKCNEYFDETTDPVELNKYLM
jgi:hypothetical protein